MADDSIPPEDPQIDAAKTVEAILGTAPRANGAAAASRVEIVEYNDLLEPNLTSKGLVKGLIDIGALALIVGLPGCGKTFLALELALSIAAGEAFLGHKVTPGRVVYLAAEAGRGIRNRVAAWARERDVGKVNFAAVVSPVDLGHHAKGKEGGATALARAIKDSGGAEVLIVDTVSRALAGANENSPDDMGAFVYVLDQLRDYLGCTIIVVHHLGKDASRGARGHSLLYGAVDTELTVERRDDAVSVMTVTKQRDMPAAQEIAFRLRSVELGLDQDGETVTSCVVEEADYVPAAKAKGPTGQMKLALDVLNGAIAERGQLVPCGDIEVRAVKVEEWREAMEKSGLFGDGQRLRTAWSRAQGKLSDDGHVAFRDGFVWPSQGTFDDIPF